MFSREKNTLNRNQIAKVLLSLVLVLAMISQFALPAMADTCTTYTWQSGIAVYNWEGEALYYSMQGAVIGHNTTQGFEVDLPYLVSTYQVGSNLYWQVTYYVPNDGSTWGVQISLGNFSNEQWPSLVYNTTVTTSGSYSGDSPATATNAANTAATDAAAAQSAANTAATNASTAATNASNAYNAANSANTNASTAANNAANANTNASTAATQATTAATQATSAASNTTYGGKSDAYWADTANTNASTAATQATSANTQATTAAIQATTAANNTIYSGQSAAYWANQAATAATSNIIPVISSLVGQNGATCTTGTTFTANVAVAPSSSITYTATGVPGYNASGNSITFTGLSSGAYTAIITATYTPTGKTCTCPFTFFKI